MATEEADEGGGLPLSLSEPERAILSALRAPSTPKDGLVELKVAEEVGLPPDVVRGSLQRLRSKRLVVVDEQHTSEPRLTERGSKALLHGLPERRLLRALVEAGGVLDPVAAEAGFSPDERSAALGFLRRRGFLAPGTPFRLLPSSPPAELPFEEERALERVAGGEPVTDEATLKSLVKRGLVALERRSLKRWMPSDEGRRIELASSAETVGALTPALLASGGWATHGFRPYDVRADVPHVTGARPHPYARWLEEFAEVLVGLGFEQAEGPLLETEFWNADVLFMPQEHPARSIHDVFSVRGVEGHPPPAELLERVAAVHEGRPLPGSSAPLGPGWGSPYSRAMAARPVVRSQTTAVSARYLARHPAAPFRMFCLDRNFRPDAVDASHHVEFNQCEGVLGESGVTLRHLVGVFHALAEAIGIREVKVRPSYFPFTEPSVEGYVRHPRLGWLEVFPGGIFRPEVLAPLGVDVPVAAWGIGVTRLAMVSLGVNDIRELFEDDLDRLTGRSG